MRNVSRLQGLLALVGCLLPVTAFAQNLPVINEIRIDQPSGDVDEYFELIGPPGFLLDGLTYVVIGDGTGGSGVIEAAVPLIGALGATGYYVVAESTFTLGVPDQTATLNFENSDNVTHLLVEGFQGVVGQDLDVDDDCVLDLMPWGLVLDLIALIEEENPPASTECHYGPPTVGPDGTFVPGHVVRCPDGVGPFMPAGFDPAAGTDTPGGPNLCPSPPVFAFGLLHSALGFAQLDASGGTLTVSNIGSSGKDGVSIDLGDPDCDAFLQTIQLPSAPPPPGASIPHTMLGHVDGEPDQLVLRLLVESVQMPSPTFQLVPDFSPVGSSTYTLKLFLDDDPVFEQSGVSGPGLYFPAPVVYSTLTRPGDDAGEFWFEYLIPGAIPMTIPGGPTILADRVVLCPDNQTALVTSLTNFWVQAADVPSFTILDEALGLFPPNLFHHRATGEAHMQASGDHLTISNIGSSGKDGVSIDLGETTEAFQALVELPTVPVAPDSTWTGEAWGQLAGTTFEQPFAFLWAQVLPQDQLLLAPDFSPIGSTTFTGRLYLAGELVALWEGGTEGVSFPIQPAYSPALAPTAWGAQAWVAFDQPVPVTLPGPGPGIVVSDTIVFDSENPTESVDFMTAIGLSAAGLPSFDVAGEILTGAVPPQTCDPVVQLSCAYDPAAQAVFLSWINTDSYASIDIERDGGNIATLPGNVMSYTDGGAPPGVRVYSVIPTCDNGLVGSAVTCTVVVPASITFIRGDCDGDGTVNFLADMLYLLTFGFLGGPPPICNEAGDVDGNGALNPLADGLYGLTTGFLGGPPPPLPYPLCGQDPDPATSIGCAPNGCP